MSSPNLRGGNRASVNIAGQHGFFLSQLIKKVGTICHNTRTDHLFKRGVLRVLECQELWVWLRK